MSLGYLQYNVSECVVVKILFICTIINEDMKNLVSLQLCNPPSFSIIITITINLIVSHLKFSVVILLFCST